MFGFVIGAIIVAVIWLLFSVASKTKAVAAFNAFDSAEPWFRKEGIDSSSVRFNTYSDRVLLQTHDAVALVGEGKRNGKPVSFVLEVSAASGVEISHFVEPAGLISNHRSIALNAKQTGRPLYSTFAHAATLHKEKYPQSGG